MGKCPALCESCYFSSLLYSTSICPGSCIHAHIQERLLCYCEHHFVLNHCAWFARQDKREQTSGTKAENKCSVTKKQRCFMISIQTHVLHFKNNPLCSFDWQDLGLHAACEPTVSVCCANESTGLYE